MTQDEILQTYTERLAEQESVAIDNFIRGYIPSWQQKLMIRFPLTKSFFGWNTVIRQDWGNMGRRVRLFRYGENIAELKITVKLEPNL